MSSAKPPPPFERSAWQDWRVWLSLIGGALVLLFTVLEGSDEACHAPGNCSVLLSAAAWLVGGFFATAGLAALLLNRRRGSRFDPVTGELEWWQHRRAGRPGMGGHIDPSRIGRIKLVEKDEHENEVLVFDTDGQRLAHFDAEVIRGRQDLWAEQMVMAFPHVVLERVRAS